MPHLASQNAGRFSDPIPTKFLLEDEFETLKSATRETDLNRSEVVRRAIRLLGRQRKVFGNYHFLIDLKPSS